MIKIGEKEITSISFGSKVIIKITKAGRTLWEAIKSCFGAGYWSNIKGWDNTDYWKN